MSTNKERLTRFYQHYAPDKVAAVDATLVAYAGREAAMFSALVKKYGPEPAEEDGYAARLTRFYQQYAPEKVGAVGATLKAYAGKEEAMFKALVKKYGPEPSSASGGGAASAPPAAAASSSGGDGGYEARLTRFYQQYAPEKVNAVGATLKAYAGKEEAMFKALVKKYGPEPDEDGGEGDDEGDADDGGGDDGANDYNARLTRFYQQYAPEKVGAVGATLKAYAGKEEAMFKALVKKYGPEPEEGDEAEAEEGGGSDHKSRLTRFYKQYAPDKVAAVDATLKAYAGREEAMFNALVKKYGPEPTSSSGGGGGGGKSAKTGGSDHKSRLTRFYAQYAPDKVAAVDATLKAYAGKEEAMFNALVKKYGPEPDAGGDEGGDDEGGGSDHKSRLTRFYKQYAPDKVAAVDATLQAYAGREEAMFNALVKKYGPEPKAGSSSGGASPRKSGGGGGNDHRSRLLRFYETHAPDKVSAVDATLKAYAGREEAMFNALVKKYGPEPEHEEVDDDANSDDGGGAASAPSASPAADANPFAVRLRRFLAKYSPSDVSKVPALLAKYKGTEEAMMAAFIKKFGPEPPPERPSVAGVPAAVAALPIRTQLSLLLNRYDPANSMMLDAMLERHAGREADLRDALIARFGPIPVPEGIAAMTAAAEAEVGGGRSASEAAADQRGGSSSQKRGGGGGDSSSSANQQKGQQQQQQQQQRAPNFTSAHMAAFANMSAQPLSPEQALVTIVGSRGVAEWLNTVGRVCAGTPHAFDPTVVNLGGGVGTNGLTPLQRESLCRLGLVLETTPPAYLAAGVPLPPPAELADTMQSIAVAPTLPLHFTEERIRGEVLQGYPPRLTSLASSNSHNEGGGKGASAGSASVVASPSEADVDTFRLAYRIFALYAQCRAVIERDLWAAVEAERSAISALWTADRARVEALQRERAHRMGEVFGAARALLGPLEDDQRAEIIKVERLYRGGLMRWHNDRMHTLVLAAPPADVRRLEARFYEWKHLVTGGNSGGGNGGGYLNPSSPAAAARTYADGGDGGYAAGEAPLVTPRDAAALSEHRKYFADLGAVSAADTWGSPRNGGPASAAGAASPLPTHRRANAGNTYGGVAYGAKRGVGVTPPPSVRSLMNNASSASRHKSTAGDYASPQRSSFYNNINNTSNGGDAPIGASPSIAASPIAPRGYGHSYAHSKGSTLYHESTLHTNAFSPPRRQQLLHVHEQQQRLQQHALSPRSPYAYGGGPCRATTPRSGGGGGAPVVDAYALVDRYGATIRGAVQQPRSLAEIVEGRR